MRRLYTILSAGAVLGLAGPAVAQNPGDTPAPAAQADPATGSSNRARSSQSPAGGLAAVSGEDAAAAPARADGGTIPPAELKSACERALRDDAEWREALGRQLTGALLASLDQRVDDAEPDQPAKKRKLEPWVEQLSTEIERKIHQRENRAIQRNNNHVIMAYAALWALVLGFVVFMWNRQRALKAEIAQLQLEVEEAAADDE
ncbi:MAG: hypothetical protein MJE77_34810 [Proteobacteria bacterium]|nr:hypothetical protein [Pseudomonadota bacterium]